MVGLKIFRFYAHSKEYEASYVLGNYCNNGCQTFHKDEAQAVFKKFFVPSEYRLDITNAFNDDELPSFEEAVELLSQSDRRRYGDWIPASIDVSDEINVLIKIYAHRRDYERLGNIDCDLENMILNNAQFRFNNTLLWAQLASDSNRKELIDFTDRHPSSFKGYQLDWVMRNISRYGSHELQRWVLENSNGYNDGLFSGIAYSQHLDVIKDAVTKRVSNTTLDDFEIGRFISDSLYTILNRISGRNNSEEDIHIYTTSVIDSMGRRIKDALKGDPMLTEHCRNIFKNTPYEPVRRLKID